MRVIVAARLSVLAEGQTGLDTQEQEVIRWAESQGHTVVGVAADFKTGKSDLTDRPNLRPWITDPVKRDSYDAIVAYKVDRLTRADKAGTTRMEEWARQHGKSLLISSAEVRFPSEGAEGAMWDMYVRMAHQEWLGIRERYVRMQSYKRSIGSLVGRAPWGYRVGPGTNAYGQPIKTLVPTDEGRLYVPAVFERVIAGQSLREVAEWLDVHGVKPMHGDQWAEVSLGQLVRNPVYSGRRQTQAGETVLEVEALVTIGTQEQAKARLAKRARPGRSGTVEAKALLGKLVCGNPACNATGVAEGKPSPMYRIKAGKGNAATYYYRCAGSGAQRKGCGNMVPLADLDALATDAFEHWHDEPHRDSVYVPGDSQADAIERLRLEMAEAIRSAEPAMIASIAQSYAEKIAELEAMPARPARWEHTETGKSVGQHYLSLDPDGRRTYLMEHDIRAWRDGARLMVTVDGMLARKGGGSALGSVAA